MARTNSMLVAAMVLVACLTNVPNRTARAESNELADCIVAKTTLAKSLLACGTELMTVKGDLLTCRTNPCVQLSTGEPCGGGLHHLTAQQGLELLLARGGSLSLEETARLTELSVSLFEQKAPSAMPEQLSVLNSHLRISKERLVRATAAVQRAEAAHR
jgi:hypothetical protein